jgi:hypothetical protein
MKNFSDITEFGTRVEFADDYVHHYVFHASASSLGREIAIGFEPNAHRRKVVPGYAVTATMAGNTYFLSVPLAPGAVEGL